MVKLIDPDDGEEYEETMEDILSRERYYSRLVQAQQDNNLPQYKYGQAVDGHSYRYNVIGRYSDGSLRTSQFDAVHLDDCGCKDPESWY